MFRVRVCIVGIRVIQAERERETGSIHLKQKIFRCIMFWSVIGADPTGMPYVEFINETWNTSAVQSKSVGCSKSLYRDASSEIQNRKTFFPKLHASR